MTKKQTLPIDLLRTDAGTQSRVSISDDTVEDYAEVLRNSTGWPFPAVDVFHDGSEYYVADGFHRVLSAHRVKRASIPCCIHKGTVTDARIFAMTANDSHGLRMSREDKRACVEWLLDNHPRMRQREVAEKAGVSARTVQYIVADRKPKKPQIANLTPPQGAKTTSKGKIGKDGRTDSDGTDSEETTPSSPRNGKEKAGDSLGKCPNCGHAKWDSDDDGHSCAKCHHPHGEPVGDRSESESAELGRKNRQLCNSLRDKLARAICDYHEVVPNRAERDRLVKVVQGVELW